MTASTNGALVAEVRQALANAEAAGNPAPGRPALARLTGASEHAVRRVLAQLAKPGEQAGGELATDAASTASPADGESPDQRQGNAEPVTPLAAGNPAGAAGEPGDTGAPAAPARAGQFASRRSSRRWVGFVFGSLTSVAANVLAARIAPQHAAAGWHPSLYAEVGAAVWPLALLLSVEGLSRVRWPNSALWNLARFGGAGTVAFGSALISYPHIAAVLAFWGYSTLAAHVGPLVVDGLMTVRGFALLATAAEPHDPHHPGRSSPTPGRPFELWRR